MLGTIAITDEGWYKFLIQHPELSELNFWTHRHAVPSELRSFRHFCLSFAHRIMRFAGSRILFNFQYSPIGSRGNPSASETDVLLSPKCTLA